MPSSDQTAGEGCKEIIPIFFGIWMWDFLISIPEEIDMWRKYSFAWVDLVYVLSRIVTACSMISIFILATGAFLDDCQVPYNLAAWFTVIGMPLNTLLFLARIIGVFHQQRAVKIIFSILWLLTFVTFLVPPTAGKWGRGPNRVCRITTVTKENSVGSFVGAIYDTLVFLAITFKILQDYPVQGWRARIGLFFDSRSMTRIFRMVLQTGQLYYLVVATVHIATLIVLLTPNTPIVCRSVSAAPSIVLTNAMACKVFRLMRSNSYRSNTEIFQLEIPQNIGGTSSPVLHTSSPGDTGVQAMVTLPQVNNVEMATRIPDGPTIRGWPPVGMEEVCL